MAFQPQPQSVPAPAPEPQYAATPTEVGAGAVLTAVESLHEGYSSIEPSDFPKEYVDKTVDMMPTLRAALQYNSESAQSTLSQYTANELYAWWSVKQTVYDDEQNGEGM